MTLVEKNITTQSSLQTAIADQREIYSPGSLLGVYLAQIKTELDGKLILISGKFHLKNPKQGLKIYGGCFYANLLGVNDTSSITLVIPEKLKTQLVQGDFYTLRGFVQKKDKDDVIQVSVRVDAIIQKEISIVDPAERRKLELVKQKADSGYKDFKKIVTENVYNNVPTRIVNIYGNHGIVDSDFEKGLSADARYFEITAMRCNITSGKDIIETIKIVSNYDVDAIALIRGGGGVAEMEIFNNPEIGAEVLHLEPCFLTALGHEVNNSLLDRLADKSFALPHDYGTSLKEYVNQAEENKNNSKSLLIKQVKEDLTKTFEAQIKTLTDQLNAKNEEFNSAQNQFKGLTAQMQEQSKQALEAKQAAFHTEAKALQEQIKLKDQAFKELKQSEERLRTESIKAATATLQANLELLENENKRLSKDIESISNQQKNMPIYIILCIFIGYLIAKYIF